MNVNEAALDNSSARYSEAGTGRIVLGALLSVLSLTAVVILGVYIAKLPVTEEALEKTGGVRIFAKIWEIMDALLEGKTSITEDCWIGYLIAAVIAPVLGLFAGVMDDALCLLPLGRAVRSHLGFAVKWYVRLAPAILFAVYYFVYLAVTTLKPETQLLMPRFSLTGEGYTGGMWFTQISLFLIALAFLIMLVEAFVNAGPLGFLLRAPLLLATNLVLSLLFCMIAMLAFVAIALIVALIVIVFLFRLIALINILN